jgi:hypothetical protein
LQNTIFSHGDAEKGVANPRIYEEEEVVEAIMEP